MSSLTRARPHMSGVLDSMDSRYIFGTTSTTSRGSPGFIPVSYTHLDVYKRQTPNTAIGYQALYGGSGTAVANTAYDNVAIGYQALYGTPGIASTGNANVAVGNNTCLLYTSRCV